MAESEQYPSHGTAPGFEVHITESQFWNEIMHDVYGPRKGGAILFVDAENARKGIAKTSCATAVARLLARAFRYGLEFEDMTIAGSRYIQRYQEHPGKEQPSVLVTDELVGGGAGDSRRAMSNANIEWGRAWQLLRAKRVVTIATLPDWNEADPRLQKYADYRLWCRERPMGYFQPYKITVPFNSGGSGPKVRTKGLGYGPNTDRISFPNMDAEGDPYYRYLARKKDQLIDSTSWDADEVFGDGEEEDDEPLSEEEIERRELTKVAIRLYQPWDEDAGHSYEDVASAIVDRGASWVGNRVREWRNGEHRELVPDPTE